MKIVCMSDTHMNYPAIPECDLLIHAGDLTNSGTWQQVRAAMAHLAQAKARRIIFVPGNHDFLFQREPELAESICDEFGIHLLLDSETTIQGLKIYGSPWQPWFLNWAFNAPSDAIEGMDFLTEKWSHIPDDTDILVTHCPPKGIGGVMSDDKDIGCSSLRRRIDEINPRLHVFGHCHMGYGVHATHSMSKRTVFVNASTCNELYQAVNAPILIHI